MFTMRILRKDRSELGIPIRRWEVTQYELGRKLIATAVNPDGTEYFHEVLEGEGLTYIMNDLGSTVAQYDQNFN